MLSWLASSVLMVSPVGGLLKGLWTWLCHRSFWQLVCLGLALFAIVQHFEIADARHDRDGYKRQRDTIQAQLDAITSAKDHQRKITAQRITVVTRTIHEAEGRAEKVESAPLPGNCKSPPEVLQADL